MPPEALDLTAALRPRLPSPLQPVEDERFSRHGIRLLLKRDDLIHPDLPGNKWRKLAPNLRAAAGRPLLTFGGAYSNHLRATAAAGRLLGFPTVGVVRGDELASRPLNPSLAQCAADGMLLVFVDRTTYRSKNDPQVLARILGAAAEARADGPAHHLDAADDFYLVPEGGSNALAARGCTALGHELRQLADVVAVACGTGGTLAGLAAGLAPRQRAIGFPVLRGGFLAGETARLQREAFGGRTGDWTLDERFHCGGYARSTPGLDAFADEFEARHGLPVERLYVAKMLYGLATLAAEGAFPPGTTIAAVVTGRPDSPEPSEAP
ncbi:1-aminocyclopropane-1-carboxylate deaminase/D-cysteine desulfhydrase [Streptomyces sp. AM8-1-1]|uniref:1-aminocyclopropane-1-carboxylate deaminase/D-cysteine desulfhydrase n=1 Tax=Streptomyces sp. AM8-1-1 TaxID=3075825 RepID=UPI0028C4DA52|nr:pyridoxal-phosphate dependent enzyme [Streptomyces sp. AM8-1-1]WNO72394.1 pyridoxal-phosphate dependent enzyme [Streptomyces sp. AM8-1-1]